MMSVRLRILVGLLLTCAQPASSARCEDFPAINARVSTSVVEILVTGRKAGGRSATEPGSGFIAYADAALPYVFVFTAAHVIGKDDEWLLNEDGKPADRKIVIRQQSGITMVPIDENASIIGIDYDTDTAVLTIAKRPISAIPVAGFDHLKQTETLMAVGFPANESKQVPLIGPVRSIDYSRMRIEIDRVIKGGQSGGPIIDGRGWAVGIAGENDDKLTPSFHRAAVVSAAVRLLNRYLDTVGRPQLSLKTLSNINKLSILSRNGRAKVSIRGDSGVLNAEHESEKTLADAAWAELAASGGERSECDEASGRTQSSAKARASVQLFENNGIKMPISLEVRGGHYRTAVTCLAGKPVGLTGHDTAAYADVDVEGEINFNLQAQMDLRIVWQDMPEGTRLKLIGPDDQIRGDIDAASGSERIITLNDTGSWRLRANISRRLRAAGGSGRDQYAGQSIVFIALP